MSNGRGDECFVDDKSTGQAGCPVVGFLVDKQCPVVDYKFLEMIQTMA